MTGGDSLALGPQLLREHARIPFRPSAAREAARRVAELAKRVGLSAQVIRGGVDVGPVELDHLWVLADGRLIDVCLPLYAVEFRQTLRKWVAGDIDDRALDADAARFGLDHRVMDNPPADCRYRGRPILHDRRPLA